MTNPSASSADYCWRSSGCCYCCCCLSTNHPSRSTSGCRMCRPSHRKRLHEAMILPLSSCRWRLASPSDLGTSVFDDRSAFEHSKKGEKLCNELEEWRQIGTNLEKSHRLIESGRQVELWWEWNSQRSAVDHLAKKLSGFVSSIH